jgi:mevalonate kinase
MIEMADSTVKAPGVIKLFGEHAVVYGKLAVAAAIKLYSKIEVAKSDPRTLRIAYPHPLNIVVEVDEAALRKAYKSRKSLPIGEYISSFSVHQLAIPWITIAARLLVEKGVTVTGKTITVTSEIPSGSGLASSASVAVAVAVALAKSASTRISDNDMIDIAREGDRIIHRNEDAGTIDVSTSYYGGYVSYSKEQGAVREDVHTTLNMLIVNTGPKKSTAETVGHVAALYKARREYVDGIMSKIELCSMEGLRALKDKDLKSIGRLMYEDQELLSALGVSSPGLDRTVEIAKRNGLLGAKLSGGGGGGIAIIAVEKTNDFAAKLFEDEGFKTYYTEISLAGGKQQL